MSIPSLEVPIVLTAAELASRIGCSTSWVKELTRRGSISPFARTEGGKQGGVWLYDPRTIDQARVAREQSRNQKRPINQHGQTVKQMRGAGMTFEQIACRLQISTATVRRSLARQVKRDSRADRQAREYAESSLVTPDGQPIPR